MLKTSDTRYSRYCYNKKSEINLFKQEQENILLSASEKQTKQRHCWAHSQHTQEKKHSIKSLFWYYFITQDWGYVKVLMLWMFLYLFFNKNVSRGNWTATWFVSRAKSRGSHAVHAARRLFWALLPAHRMSLVVLDLLKNIASSNKWSCSIFNRLHPSGNTLLLRYASGFSSVWNNCVSSCWQLCI